MSGTDGWAVVWHLNEEDPWKPGVVVELDIPTATVALVDARDGTLHFVDAVNVRVLSRALPPEPLDRTSGVTYQWWFDLALQARDMGYPVDRKVWIGEAP